MNILNAFVFVVVCLCEVAGDDGIPSSGSGHGIPAYSEFSAGRSEDTLSFKYLKKLV